MRGYFGIGCEEISKPMNMGALMRTAHAFGASFFFSINAHAKVREVYNADTSRSMDHLPYYPYDRGEDLLLPKGCVLVGIELTDDAVDLPSFKHPPAAAYVLGRERGSISPGLLAKCAHVVKIPTKFCVNVGLAGALVMYDRVLSLGGYPARPVRPGGPPPEMLVKPRGRV
ncbi:MAG: RNA methyltransferase [Alphaproteobacteria bacterium]|nr:RNA methyltransferase [Alphaproteobacteria bacterium]